VVRVQSSPTPVLAKRPGLLALARCRNQRPCSLTWWFHYNEWRKSLSDKTTGATFGTLKWNDEF
jgi:hypothetical protein